MSVEVTLIPGDGVGPEITRAVQRLIEAVGVPIAWDVCEAGALAFKRGISTGVPRETIDSLKRTRVALKGPLETPIGYGEKSANVTLRALFDTYATLRPTASLPGIETPFSSRDLDFVIVRENVEDLYIGAEYLETGSVAEALKIISHEGSERIIRFAFELARAEGRKTVHCATKANILKITEGLFKRTFEEISKDYPDITAKHLLIDNCAQQLVIRPEMFDVIVTTNLHGDIITDLASGLVGGLGVAPSANLGREMAIFEAVHGSAPDIAGKNVANPTALIRSALLMLRHLGEQDAANQIEQALFYTLGIEKIRTPDLDPTSTVTTSAFTDRIIQNLGQETPWPSAHPYHQLTLPHSTPSKAVRVGTLVGFDLYLQSRLSPTALGQSLEALALPFPFALYLLSNRGVQVYPVPEGYPPDLIDYWCARFLFKKEDILGTLDHSIMEFLMKVGEEYSWLHLQKLQKFTHSLGFTKAQGED